MEAVKEIQIFEYLKNKERRELGFIHLFSPGNYLAGQQVCLPHAFEQPAEASIMYKLIINTLVIRSPLH